MKRGPNGEPVLKQRFHGALNPMEVNGLFNSAPPISKNPRQRKRTAKKNKSVQKKSKHLHKTSKVPRSGKYDFVTAFMDAQSGLSFGQHGQGDAEGARKELDKSFGNGKLKFGVVVENLEYNEDMEDTCLAVPVVHIYGKVQCIISVLHALLATSTIEAFILVSRLTECTFYEPSVCPEKQIKN